MAEQLGAGFSHTEVLQALMDAGWSEALVQHALGQASGSEPTTGPKAVPDALPDTQTNNPPVPWPTGAGERLLLNAGDRQVTVSLVMESPALLVLEGFLSHQECQALIDAAKPRLSRSLTVDTHTGGQERNRARTSEGMFFEREETELVSRIEARIAHLFNWPLLNGENLQVLRYRPGAEYQPHYDYFDPAAPGTDSILARGGQRVATLVIYLNEPEAGGATEFPDIALAVLPKRGNAVFFNYAQPHPVSLTLHGGAPVRLGEKWIATKWLREREFF